MKWGSIQIDLQCQTYSLHARYRNEPSLRILKTRDVLSVLRYILKDFKGKPKLEAAGQQVRKNKDCRLGQFLTGMYRRAPIQRGISAIISTFTKISCQSTSGGRGNFVIPQGCSRIHTYNLTQKWDQVAWKGRTAWGAHWKALRHYSPYVAIKEERSWNSCKDGLSQPIFQVPFM